LAIFIRGLFLSKLSLSGCLFGCLSVSNKRQNVWTDQAQILCGTSRSPRKDFWMIKISNIGLHQKSIFIKFLKILKIHKNFFNPRTSFVLFYDVSRGSDSLNSASKLWTDCHKYQTNFHIPNIILRYFEEKWF